MSVALIGAEVDDLPLLQAFMRGLYAADERPPAEDAWLAALQDLLADPRWGRAWLIAQHGRAVGYVVVTFGYSLEFYGRDAFVDELYVAEAFRDQGIGRAAMALVECEVRRLGIGALHLEVEEANAAAQRVYGAAGFQYRGHMHLMSKRLCGEPG